MSYTRRQLEVMADRIEAICAGQMIGARCRGGQSYQDGTILFDVVVYTGPCTFSSLPSYFSWEVCTLLKCSEVVLDFPDNKTMTLTAIFDTTNKRRTTQ